jgi:hypothetical protein
VRYVEANLGISTADAGEVVIGFEDGCLRVSFVDWREQPQSITFPDTLAFQWRGEAEDSSIPRDDTTFELVESPLLCSQAAAHAVPAPEYAHYVLCFNAVGVLDIVALRLPPRP